MRRNRRAQPDAESLTGLFGADPNGDSPHPASWVTRYLFPFGMVLIAALALLSEYTKLPWWVTTPAVLYLVVVGGVSLYNPAVRLSRWLRRKTRRSRLVKSTERQLAETLQELTNLLYRDQADTVLYLLKETAQWEELKTYHQLRDFEHLETLNRWLSALGARMAEYRRHDFESLCHDFSALVHRYNRYCGERNRTLQEAITAGKIAEPRLRYLKQQWNVRREGHVEFVRRSTELSMRINQSLGQQLCASYNEPLGTLE